MALSWGFIRHQRPRPRDKWADVAKRIVIYGINYAPELAGVGRYTGEIGEYLAAGGHRVCVITTPPHYPGWKAQVGYSGARWTRETVAGADVYRCPLFLNPDMRGFKRLLAPLTFALSSAPVAIWQIIRRRPDVVMVVEPALFAAPVALFAASLVGAKTVLHVQDLEVEAAFAVGHLSKGGVLARVAKQFDYATTQGFDRIITISNRMAEKIAAKGVDPTHIKVIRNWVDIDQIKPLSSPSPYRKELELADGAFVVLYTGNIGIKQGVRLLIEAAELLADDPSIALIVAGEGPMRKQVEAAAQRLPNLRLLPFQPEARFCDFLGLADLHVLPQERNAADLLLPSKLGGMLASGRPIVVTAEPGTELADFLDQSCTFTAPGDANALAVAIRALAKACVSEEAATHRRTLAAALSKTELIEEFAVAALFENPAPARRAVGYAT